MPGITATWTVVSDRFGELIAKAEAGGPEALRVAAEAVGTYADPITPVDTGELLHSRTTSIAGNTATVSWPTDHSIYPEMGTRKMAAEPYARPAAAQAGKDFEAAVAAIFDAL